MHLQQLVGDAAERRRSQRAHQKEAARQVPGVRKIVQERLGCVAIAAAGCTAPLCSVAVVEVGFVGKPEGYKR